MPCSAALGRWLRIATGSSGEIANVGAWKGTRGCQSLGVPPGSLARDLLSSAVGWCSYPATVVHARPSATRFAGGHPCARRAARGEGRSSRSSRFDLPWRRPGQRSARLHTPRRRTGRAKRSSASKAWFRGSSLEHGRPWPAQRCPYASKAGLEAHHSCAPGAGVTRGPSSGTHVGLIGGIVCRRRVSVGVGEGTAEVPDSTVNTGPKATPDAALDATLDAAPDAALDAISSVDPDMVLDAIPDPAPDTASNAIPDTASDAIPDALPTPPPTQSSTRLPTRTPIQIPIPPPTRGHHHR